MIMSEYKRQAGKWWCRQDYKNIQRRWGINEARREQKIQKINQCVCVWVYWASPSDAEADGAHVGQDVIEQVIASTSGLQVDVELGELQLDVIDVVEEQHQDANVVISERQETLQ